jgi:polysaccharide export outer membrane protein
LICALPLLVACLRIPAACRALQSQSESVANPAQPSKPGSAMPAPSSSAKNSATAASPDFVIGPSDVLNVNVWREAEISRSVPVRPDGKISLPLLGDLQASGLTADQLQNVIKKGLKDYISNPEVTVIVQEVKSRQVNVVGQVAKPGSYVLAKNMTVLDAIATAGGFKDFAKTKKIYVLRITDAGNRTRLPFNYKEVIKGRESKQDIELQPRDTVVVP